ncbi:MAG TPA: hypothetical protein P5137_06260 [Candidatus Brocadiia bacterium]|nr:hypothetical protein [Candidatus Brocadiia bacterium]
MSCQTQTNDLDQAAARVEAAFQKQLADIRAANRMFLIAGIVLAAAIAAYLHIIAINLASYIEEPRTLAAFVRAGAEGQIPLMISELKTSLKRNAPGMVSDVRSSLMAELPSVREQAEKSLAKILVNETMGILKAQVTPLIKNAVTNDRKKLEPLINQAATQPDALARELESVFVAGLAKPIKEELDKDHNKKLREIRDYLRRLRAGKNLTMREEYEKEQIADFIGAFAKLLEESVKASK